MRQSRRLAKTGVGYDWRRMAWKVPGRGLGCRLRVKNGLAQEGLATRREYLTPGCIASTRARGRLCPRLRAECLWRSRARRGMPILRQSNGLAGEFTRVQPTDPGHVGRKRDLAGRADQIACGSPGFARARRDQLHADGAGLRAGASGQAGRLCALGQAERSRSAGRFKRHHAAEGSWS